MSPRFVIEIDWERLEHGLPEERATFGAVGIRVDGTWLTEAQDAFVNRVRQRVHLSGYQLAQWLAWNWWRLRWEPKRASLGWLMAHRMTNIGGGYVWPNIECTSDGERVLLQAVPATSRATEPLRYVAEVNEVLPALELQSGVDQFIELVLEKLRTEGIGESNLERIWTYVVQERRDPESAWYRKLEAALGFDPDEADEQVIATLIAEGEALGNNAVAEMAAGASRDMPAPTSAKLMELAENVGHEVSLANIPRLPAEALEGRGANYPAWVVGEAAARALRSHEKLGDGPLSDQTLAELAGTVPAVLSGDAAAMSSGDVAAVPFSFVLNGGGTTAKVVLQSRIDTNRRFALARLVGDRVLEQSEEPLIPIMRSVYSYRQKLQRAFAAELLCPFDTVRQQLDVDQSDESQERVAADYRVSSYVVRTQLVNKGLLGRQALDF